MDPERTRQARRLFAGIAPEYDRMGSVLSFGQDPRWRRFLVSKVNAIPGSWVLDVATGTGLVARELASKNVRVVGLDQSAAMVARGVEAVRRRGLDGRVRFALGQAQGDTPDAAIAVLDETGLSDEDKEKILTGNGRTLLEGAVQPV